MKQCHPRFINNRNTLCPKGEDIQKDNNRGEFLKAGLPIAFDVRIEKLVVDDFTNHQINLE